VTAEALASMSDSPAGLHDDCPLGGDQRRLESQALARLAALRDLQAVSAA
jgi:hypothetical protein